MRILFLSILLTVLSMPAFSQSNSYYATDTSSAVGVKIIDYGDVENAKFCHVQRGNSVIKFSPNDITEYAFKKGEVYASKEIIVDGTPKKVFLEVLSKGEVSAYKYTGENTILYFVEKENMDLTQVPTENKKEFHNFIKNLTANFQEVNQYSSLVKANEYSLKVFFNNYNNRSTKYFPFTKFGIIGGYSFSKFTKNNSSNLPRLKNYEMDYNGGANFGVFIERPFFSSNTSLNIKLFYTQNDISNTLTYDEYKVLFEIKSSAISAPILIKYATPMHKKQFFVNVGGIFTYHLGNESKVWSLDKTTGELEILSENEIIAGTMYGVALGGGFQYNLNFKNSISLEVLWTNFYTSGDKLNKNQIHIMTGINF